MANANFDNAALAWTLPWDADWVTAVAFLGDTRRIAAGNNLGEILVWELPEKPGGAPPKPIRKLQGHTNVISRLRGSADGKTLVSASYDHSIRVWDMQAPAAGTAEVVLNARAIAEAEARKGSKAPVPVPAKVQLQSAAQMIDAHKEWISNISFDRDEKHLLSGDDAGEVILWDWPGRKELRRWKAKSWVYGLALSPDGKQAFVSERRPLVFDAGRQAGVKLWNAETGQVFKDLDAEFKGVYLSSAAYSPDGKLLAVGRGGEADTAGGKVWLYNPADGKKIKELTPVHMYGITDLAFHPDGKHFASAGRDTVVRLWNAADGKMVKELGKPRGGQFKDWICALSISPDGKWLAGADMAGAVQIYSLG